jgi:nucleotide-binding universal stress UspA family protein
MYNKILVPLDGSKLSECSLNHVKQLFENSPAGEVVLLNAVVIEIPWRRLNEGEKGHKVTFDIGAFEKSFFDESRKYLAKVKYRLSSEGLNVKTETIESKEPSDTITEYAQSKGVDLIVISTHGYNGIQRMMLGSVALKVLHKSNVPVLLIRPEACHT